MTIPRPTCVSVFYVFSRKTTFKQHHVRPGSRLPHASMSIRSENVCRLHRAVIRFLPIAADLTNNFPKKVLSSFDFSNIDFTTYLALIDFPAATV